jgi:prepilin-type N-terminal cleavage/methylation domain-containing protein
LEEYSMTPKNKGMTLIEVMIASVLTVILTGAAILVFTASESLSTTELALRDSEYQAQRATDQLVAEITESDQAAVKLNLANSPFNDPRFTPPSQRVIVIPSARDPLTNIFASGGDGRPDWKRLVVYAPYFIPNRPGTVPDGRQRVLRRYETTLAASLAIFKDPNSIAGRTITVTHDILDTNGNIVTPGTITLAGGAVLTRSTGQQVADRVVEIIVSIDPVTTMLRAKIALDRSMVTTQISAWNGPPPGPPLKTVAPVPPVPPPPKPPPPPPPKPPPPPPPKPPPPPPPKPPPPPPPKPPPPPPPKPPPPPPPPPPVF